MNNRQRKSLERESIVKQVYAGKGKAKNPYEKGTRQFKIWDKTTTHYWNMESIADDMALAYGEYRPDKLEKKQENNY